MIKNFANTVRRFKTFTLLNLVGLTIAFLAFMVIIMQVRVELTRDTSYPDSERIYTIQQQFDWKKGLWTSLVPRPLYDAIPSIIPQVEQYATCSFSSSAFGGERYKFESATGKNYAFNSTNSKISRSFVDMFDMQIIDGAIGSANDPWLMIPESIAKQHFPNSSAVGQMLHIVDQGAWMPVSAVYRDFPSTSSFLNEIYSNVGNDDVGQLGDYNYNIYLKIKQTSSIADMTSSLRKYIAENKISKNTRLTPISELYFSTDSDNDSPPSSTRNSLMVFIFLALLIVLIAGINYVNFTTALIPTRLKDINTRKIYGATNASIRLQLVCESVMMCLVSFIIATGVIMCFKTLDSVSFISTRIVIAEQIAFTSMITGLLSIGIGILAGLYPALYATSIKEAYVLKGAFAMSGKGRTLRNILLCVQYILSITLISIAIVMNLQYDVLRKQDMGFDRNNVLHIQLSEKLTSTQNSFINSLRQHPDIQEVTYTNFYPFFSDQTSSWKRTHRDTSILFEILNVHSSFTKFFDIKIVQGRDFNESDDIKAQHSVLLFNQTAQKTYDIKIGDMVEGMEVVGITNDFNYKPLNSKIGPMALSIIGYTEGWVMGGCLYIRCQSSSYGQLIDFIRKEGLAIDPDWQAEVAFMDSRINELYKNEARTIFQINISSAIAIIISLLGVFGLIHFDMQRRRKEIALRKINGAKIMQVLVIFNKKFVYIVCICFVVAVPLALWVSNMWLEGFAYRTPVYWWIFALALFIVLLITVLTVTIQSWRTASENPINSLKSE